MSSAADAVKLDTPHFSLTPSAGKAIEVQNFIRKRLDIMSFKIETALFFDKLLPFPLAQSVLDELSDQDWYKEEKWKDLPSKEEKSAQLEAPEVQGSAQASRSPSPGKRKKGELLLYEPFVKIANAIMETSVEISDKEDKPLLRGRWVDTHGRSPVVANPYGNTLLPDVSFVRTTMGDELKKWPRRENDETQEVQVKSLNSVVQPFPHFSAVELKSSRPKTSKCLSSIHLLKD
jgi:hypothetical protein